MFANLKEKMFHPSNIILTMQILEANRIDPDEAG